MRDSKKLHPDLQVFLAFGIFECYLKGLNVRITETNRTIEEQNNYYNQGHSQVRGNDFGSMHQWGVAFDVCRNDGTGAYDFNKWIDKVAKIYKSYPLAWGGDWKGFVDQPHFQMKAYEDSYGSTGKLKKSYKNPDIFMKKWKKSLITQQFAELNISRTKALLEKCFTTVKTNCGVFAGNKVLKKKGTVKKGDTVYILKDFGTGVSQIIYLKGSKICTGYICNIRLNKPLSVFKTIKLPADNKMFDSKTNAITGKITKDTSKVITTLKKGSKIQIVSQSGSYLRVYIKVAGKWKFGWIKK